MRDVKFKKKAEKQKGKPRQEEAKLELKYDNKQTIERTGRRASLCLCVVLLIVQITSVPLLPSLASVPMHDIKALLWRHTNVTLLLN